MKRTSINIFTGFLLQILLAGLIVSSPAGLAGRSLEPGGSLLMQRPNSLPVAAADRQPGAEPKVESDSGKKQSPPEDRTGLQPKPAPGAEVQKKTFQPFKPTEKIPADQAVDFPSDI